MQNNMHQGQSDDRFNRREFLEMLGGLAGLVTAGCSINLQTNQKSPQFRITFDAAKNDSSLRQQYVKERKEKALDMIAEIYGEDIKNKIPAIEYIDKVTNIGTHFTKYGTHKVDQIFRGNITVDSIGATADCFEDRCIQNEADFMATLVGKEGGLVALINEGAGGLVWLDFSLGGELFDYLFNQKTNFFNLKLHSHFAESYTYGLTYKHIMDGRFDEFGKNSQASTDHHLNLYFSEMAATLIEITNNTTTNNSRNNGETLVIINDPRAVKIMNALLIPLGDYLPECYRLDPNEVLEKEILKTIELSKNEQASLRLTFQDGLSSSVYVYPFSNNKPK